VRDTFLSNKRSAEDLAKTIEFGKIVGAGVGCFLVGASVFVPRKLRTWNYS